MAPRRQRSPPAQLGTRSAESISWNGLSKYDNMGVQVHTGLMATSMLPRIALE
jgi:hypothetical protein